MKNSCIRQIEENETENINQFDYVHTHESVKLHKKHLDAEIFMFGPPEE